MRARSRELCVGVVMVGVACASSTACGSRSYLYDNLGPRFVEDASTGSGGGDGIPTPMGMGPGPCTPLPGVSLTTVSGIYPQVAVHGATLYVGTEFIGMNTMDTAIIAYSLQAGAPAAWRSVPAGAYLGGALAFDASRIYYLQQTSPTPAGTGAVPQGLVAQDLATNIPQAVPSPQTVVAFAATPAKPGVFWLGGPLEPIGTATTLYYWDPATGANETWATGQDFQGVAVDDTAVYWAETGGDGGGNTVVYSAPLSGGAALVLGHAPWSVARGRIVGLTTDSVVFSSDSTIDAISKAGGLAYRVVTVPDPLFAWADGDSVYWSNQAQQAGLMRKPLAGGQEELFWQEPQPDGYMVSLAFDACNVYIGSMNDSHVYGRAK
jgi:hypothetical protein